MGGNTSKFLQIQAVGLALFSLYMKKICLSLLFGLLVSSAVAQTYSLRGQLFSPTDEPIAGAGVTLISLSDQAFQRGIFSQADGQFVLRNLKNDRYALQISAVGYDPYRDTVNLSSGSLDLGRLSLSERSFTTDQVDIEGQQAQAQQKGDTTQYNAGAFKTNPDASAQDLVEKLPGVSVQNGQVQAQGERVQQVTVDGKPFFGNDPNAALKNLPAEVIDKIEVFDQQSEQSKFTGIDDGNTTKTINIVTKPESRNGVFGRGYGGYGYEDVYNAGVSLNFFDDDRRVSVLGLSNNINIQNFGEEDLLGVSSAGRGRRQPRWQGPTAAADPSDFLVSDQGGITSTQAAGINYSDEWGEKIEVSGSYFFNYSENTALTESDRVYFVEGDSGQIVRESNQRSSQNLNHRANFRLKYEISDRTSILWNPNFSWQQNQGDQSIFSRTSLRALPLLQNQTDFRSDLSALNAVNDLYFRHRFEKRGRTFTTRVRTTFQRQQGDNFQQSEQVFLTEPAIGDSLDQQARLSSSLWDWNIDTRYTEPLKKLGLLQFDYTFAPQFNEAEQLTQQFEEQTSEYTGLDSSLSSVFRNRYLAHQVGGGLLIFKGRKFFFLARARYQWATLAGDQSLPQPTETDFRFQNVLPFMIVRWRMSDQNTLRVIYRTSTQIPTASQLQGVIDNRNPQQLSAGNPDLGQSYDHRVILRLGGTNTEKSTVFYGLINATFTENHIGQSTVIARRDTLLGKGIFLPRGAQFSQPINLDGYVQARGYLTYGFPLFNQKLNTNFDFDLNYTRTPGLINGDLAITDDYGTGLGVSLSSNISENVDFTIKSRSSFNRAINQLRPQLSTDYFSQVSSLKLNLIFGPGLVIRSSVQHTYTEGLSEAVDPNFLLWNAAVAKKLFKNQRGELELSVFDALGQNTSVNRTVTNAYVEDLQTQVLQRYYMLTFTYNLRQFNADAPDSGR
jgi:hypothetical protein